MELGSGQGCQWARGLSGVPWLGGTCGAWLDLPAKGTSGAWCGMVVTAIQRTSGSDGFLGSASRPASLVDTATA